MRGRRLEKLLNVLNLLSRHQGGTLEDLSRVLGETERSARRYVESLEKELGLAIKREKQAYGEGTRYRLPKALQEEVAGYTVPRLHLDPQEIIALYLLKGQAGVLQGTVFEQNMNRAFDKLAAFLPQGTFARLDRLRALFVQTAKFTKDYTAPETAEIIRCLVQAILDSETCFVAYHAFQDDRTRAYKIDPLHLFENTGGLYAVVRTTRFGHIRTLAVERIRELKPAGQTFTYPADFDPHTYLDPAFNLSLGEAQIQVKVWFSKRVARYVQERKWSPRDRIERKGDGAMILTITTSGRRDLREWILSYGPDARVLEPDDLREEILEELDAMAAAYV